MENELIKSLVSIVSFFNRTDRDQAFVKSAGVDLEATSFQLFVTIGRMQPTNVSDLANVLGKSHSSVSRQIDKLEKKQLVTTQDASNDARIREIKLSVDGERITKIINQTRLANIQTVLADWSDSEKETLVTSLNHLAETLNNMK
ncbi:MarR family winged helix-turn-helix transcriptional regulator [Companilactobacillus kimchiensis]|uniref:Transcriptional regulator n=1 Tax=Companilactobacillus kimchiensis TaxID=993692 RepID=A0A0R2LIQ7_9LACO|nr:MarR family transcriptional regulator [Companilactobacillus kimchiensis]KRN98004.1 transcriptional regulator [Companilactobacillus kimchiensis]